MTNEGSLWAFRWKISEYGRNTLEALVVGHMLVLDFLVGGFWDKAAPISLDPLLYVAGFTFAHLT